MVIRVKNKKVLIIVSFKHVCCWIYFQRTISQNMGSPSPSQPFGNYSQPGGGTLGIGALGLQQPSRSLSGQQFSGRLGNSGSHLPGHVTPTSSGILTFPTSLQNNLPSQQPSPNRSMLPLNTRGLQSQRPLNSQEIKRMVEMTGTLGGNSSSMGLIFGVSRNSRSFPSTSLMNSTLTSAFSSNPDSNPYYNYNRTNALDLSEFPSLTNRGPQESNTSSLAPSIIQGRPPYVGMVKQPPNESSEFHIHNEDFPALPGSQKVDEMMQLGWKALIGMSGQENSQGDINKVPSSSGTENSKDGRFPGDKPASSQKRGIQTSKDGRVTNIPVGMVTDQFGMVGLLTFIRAAESDSSLVSLALGSDLTTLGLNLNSPEKLYPNFGGPWAEQPCRPQDIDYHVPSEYLINQNIRDKLAPVKLNRYGEDLLFFLFYMFSGDILQLSAAAELYSRDWRFHKDERVWITRAPGMGPTEKTNTFERGTYYFFDAVNWRKVAKEFHLEYDRLEERPHIPQAFPYNPFQTMMA
ncbi:CCR4-NOT transcription complex subunit 2-like isoform X5 [Tachypleus tridentatus]|uniref:CCR4-NOT transcription complex subunit 2-like isoform X5 n=1 Tax=Tachypleus tridentatus TaxID=6853 RepID=UPI003FD6AEBE